MREDFRRMVPPVFITIFFFIFLFSVQVFSSSSASDEDCPSTFDCGRLGKLGFPLTTGTRQDCGMLAIHGCENPNPNATKTVKFSSEKELLVTGTNGFDNVYLRDAGLQKSLANQSCEAFNTNITLPPTSALGYFVLDDNQQIITLFKCNRTLNNINTSTGFFEYKGCVESTGETIYFGNMYTDENDAPASLAACPRIKLPAASMSFAAGSPFASLDSDYSVQARLSDACSRCVSDKGFCRLDAKAQFYCSKSKENSRPGKMKLIIGLTSGAIGTVLICIIIFCFIIKSLRQKIDYLKKTSRTDQNIEAFIRNHGPLALTRYKYAEVKKMTKSFQVKLGQGGYGSVYKGELLNGCPVAIKLLKSSKGNGEDFINEVASISKTSHVNVVNLLGFCLEGRKKALIYEFMPNGSLDKFIQNTTDKTGQSLTWENLYEIAIGTARGLEYLYRGCKTRILHFDIKPHNILLDEGFCPKISDFGLAKLCPRKESIVSISEARGTIGYLAPEVWNRNIGRVSHKSDVFSYGMLLLDMVGERKNMNAEDRTTETYFPDWIYEKIEQGNKLGQDRADAMDENEITKKLTIVGLWCIQTFPTQRPTISRVIEMLEGSLDSLEMPPKPVMLSPPRIELESSATCNTNSENDDYDSSSQMLETH